MASKNNQLRRQGNQIVLTDDAALPVPETLPDVAIEQELDDSDAARILQIHAETDQQFMARTAEMQLNARDRTNMVQITRVIDPHEGRLATIRKIWVEVTPSLCIDCGYDAAEAIGFGRPHPISGKTGWHSIAEDLQFDVNRTVREFALQTLERHKIIRHAAVRQDKIKTRAEVKNLRKRSALPEGFVTNPKV
jgi:hypothetical protein